MSRVGINLLWMVPSVVGGSETYTTRLLRGLKDRNTDFEYLLFALPQFADAHPDLASAYDVAYAPLTGQVKSFRVAGENTWLATQVRRKKIDLVHHGGGTMPFLRTSRSVLTIHDLQYLYFPEYFTKTKLQFLKTMVPRSAEAARLVLVPSEYTRRTVIERLRIDPSVVIVVPHGIAPREETELPSDVRERYEIPGHFFLYPAVTYPHKNHLILIEGFAKLLEKHPDTTLVLTGAKAWREWKVAKEMGERINTEISNLGIDDRVRRLGFIPVADLEALYAQATGLTFPSRFEGFGAPALEAMARGCPVIASNVTALPEVVGNHGCLVSPDNAEEWTEAMIELIEDEDLREALAMQGPLRARDFGWDHSSEILESSYRHALETTL